MQPSFHLLVYTITKFQIRVSVDKFKYLWVFAVENMRNTFLKDIRATWREKGRFFFGKNKVMAKALGTNIEDEYRENLRLIAAVGIGYSGRETTEALNEYDQ